jgi:hypothetical protein
MCRYYCKKIHVSESRPYIKTVHKFSRESNPGPATVMKKSLRRFYLFIYYVFNFLFLATSVAASARTMGGGAIFQVYGRLFRDPARVRLAYFKNFGSLKKRAQGAPVQQQHAVCICSLFLIWTCTPRRCCCCPSPRALWGC